MAQSLSMFYHVFISLPIMIIAQETILTNEYGNQNGNYYSTLDQGRISLLNNWGVDFTGIHIRDWKSDLQTNYNEIYGYGWYHQSCPSLNISTNDYIIGYKIYVDTATYYVDDEDETETVTMDIIRGLVFYTLNGESYSCIEDASVESYSDMYTNYYLSGWNVYSQKVLNSIQFQFTQTDASISSDDDNDAESTPTPSSTDPISIPTLTSTNDDDDDDENDADSPSSTQNLDRNESMETNDDFFSSTVNSESGENPTETKYPQSEDSFDADSPSSTSSSSQSAEDSQDNNNNNNASQDGDDSDDIELEFEIEQTKTIVTDIQNEDAPNQSTTTTKVIHAVEQNNDGTQLEAKGFSQFFTGSGGTVVIATTMTILIFTLVLCCVLTLCVISIKRKKRQREANQNEQEIENYDEPSPADNNDNDLKLTIPTHRMGERGNGPSSHDIKVSVDGIDGMDGNDTMIHNISNLLSPRYGRRSTDDGSNSAWPISPIPRVNNKGIAIKDRKRRRQPPVPLDHPYSIDWNEPRMLKLTDKMANLFNEEDNNYGSFISTVKTSNNASRQPSQMTVITVSGHGHNDGSETSDAETDNDTDLMYNHMGPLNERKITPQTKGGDDQDEDNESEKEKEEDEDEESESLDDNDGNNLVPRRNALKLLDVRSNTFGH